MCVCVSIYIGFPVGASGNEPACPWRHGLISGSDNPLEECSNPYIYTYTVPATDENEKVRRV